MAMPQLNPALLANRVYEVGERVHLAADIQGSYWRAGKKLSASAFVGNRPPVSYGAANSLASAEFVIESRYPTPRGVSVTTEAEKWTYKISHQLPVQVLDLPFTVDLVKPVCHMNLSPVRLGQPAAREPYAEGQTVYLTKPMSGVVTTDPKGKMQDLKMGSQLKIQFGPQSRTKRALVDLSKSKNFNGHEVYYSCDYQVVIRDYGCYWKSTGQIAHQFIRPFP